jgi:hypothetical protein
MKKMKKWQLVMTAGANFLRWTFVAGVLFFVALTITSNF